MRRKASRYSWSRSSPWADLSPELPREALQEMTRDLDPGKYKPRKFNWMEKMGELEKRREELNGWETRPGATRRQKWGRSIILTETTGEGKAKGKGKIVEAEECWGDKNHERCPSKSSLLITHFVYAECAPTPYVSLLDKATCFSCPHSKDLFSSSLISEISKHYTFMCVICDT